jgi:hypothetical protein
VSPTGSRNRNQRGFSDHSYIRLDGTVRARAIALLTTVGVACFVTKHVVFEELGPSFAPEKVGQRPDTYLLLSSSLTVFVPVPLLLPFVIVSATGAEYPRDRPCCFIEPGPGPRSRKEVV